MEVDIALIPKRLSYHGQTCFLAAIDTYNQMCYTRSMVDKTRKSVEEALASILEEAKHYDEIQTDQVSQPALIQLKTIFSVCEFWLY